MVLVTLRKRRLGLVVSHATSVDRPERNSGNTFPCTGHSGHGVDIAYVAEASPRLISHVQTKIGILGEEEYRLCRWTIVSVEQ